ncbi:MAG: nucleotidyl transferase AbiEii/AbiGii toxin family protein [Dehalococcoidia bacterium]
MIRDIDLRERAAEWLLREDIVEKDYVLGWLLWGIATHAELNTAWVFKGGTCLKKCHFETYRFSEDLDFTVREEGPIQPEELRRIFAEIAARIYDESGIEIPPDDLRFDASASGAYLEGRIYYRGPRNPRGDLPRIKLDLTSDEVLVQPPVLRPIAHPYPDELPGSPQIYCYAFEEIFAEKLRAMGERGRPRDLYDIINLYRRPDLRVAPDLIMRVLQAKCEHKGMVVPTLATLEASPYRSELEAEWANMLGHQLPQLPPFETLWSELAGLFAWLEGRKAAPAPLQAVPVGADVEAAWRPPPTVWRWGVGVPLEAIRFAGANRLCIDLGYQSSTRRVEPYSLRRTQTGNLLFFARRVDSGQIRAYRVDRIQSIEVTTQPFVPVFEVEVWGAAPPLQRARSSTRMVQRHRRRTVRPPGLRYLVECLYCGKRFTRRDTRLRKHKMPNAGGFDCPGRTGYIVDTVYD